MKKKIVIATKNTGKTRELREMLTPLGFDVVDLNEAGFKGEIEETGTSFEENALIKARAIFKQKGGYVLADDSGLECDDLDGDPGVYSARFAGPKATDEDNNNMLIERMSQIHDPSRRARYVCVLVLIDPAGKETVIRETCEGIITLNPSGKGGFGYDPYFYLADKKCTMAELPLAVKNQISHRGKALKKMLALLSA
ncbi:XTP/dITP diphosphatase [bacterium]|nr:XTP/dITP diphosphatase [bacterium]